MERVFQEAKISICRFNNNTATVEFNYLAQSFSSLSTKFAIVFEEMLKKNSTILVKKLELEEFLVVYMGNDSAGEMFALINTKDLEKQLNEMEKIKASVEEIDTILNAIHDDILITDGKGIILRIYPSFEKLYSVSSENAVGKSVYELEKKGVFTPSVTSVVLQQKQQVTMMQENKMGRKIIVTAIPIINQQGEILKVISFSRDLTDFLKLKEQYEKQEETIKIYSAEIEKLRESQRNLPGLIINSKVMQNVMEIVDKVSKSHAHILLEGESGVGKSMLAQLIHTKSTRCHGPFIEINCGSIPDNLLESELYGYEKGAFTGANNQGKVGLIQLADKGTLFLDEIGELPFSLQTKLLKVIQDKKIIRIGGTKEIEVDFRLITATNKKLNEMVALRKFREDLYYRLNVININIPPLRDRKDDIFNLAIFFLNQFNHEYQVKKTLSPEVIDRLSVYEWPGNIRELKNLIERMILTSDGNKIGIDSLPENMRKIGKSSHRHCTLEIALEQLEGQLIREAYGKHKTTTGVARELGISQATAVRKIKKHIK